MIKNLLLALLLISPAVLTTPPANASDFYDTKASTEQGEIWAQLGIGSLITSAIVAGSYNRDSFFFESYKPNTSIGFYTNQSCDFINIDHVVSLKDAYVSGAASWSTYKKRTFANDKSNHVPSCGRVNSSKGSAGPNCCHSWTYNPTPLLNGIDGGKGCMATHCIVCEKPNDVGGSHSARYYSAYSLLHKRGCSI